MTMNAQMVIISARTQKFAPTPRDRTIVTLVKQALREMELPVSMKMNALKRMPAVQTSPAATLMDRSLALALMDTQEMRLLASVLT